MSHSLKTILITTSFLCLSFSAVDAAASKGPKVDKMLQSAIEDSVQDTATDSFAKDEAQIKDLPAGDTDSLLATGDMDETYIEPVTAEEPVMESMQADSGEPLLLEETQPAPQNMSPGIAWGDYVITPRLSLQGAYNDNLLATETNTQEDFVKSIQPGLNIRLDDNNPHKLEIDAGWETRLHSDQDDDDQNNFNVSLDGVIADKSNFSIPLSVGYKSYHEDRADDLSAQRPEEVLKMTKFYAATGIRFTEGPYLAEILGHFEEKRHDDDRDAQGNPVIRRDADHDTAGTSARFEFALGEHHKMGVSGRWGDNDYNKNNYQGGGFNGPNRSSDKLSALAMWSMAFKSFTAKLKGGYGEIDYEDDAQIADIEEVIGSVEFGWAITDRLNLKIDYIRDLHEDEEIIQPIRRDMSHVSMDYKLGDHLLARIGGRYDRWEFEETTREDKYIGVDAGLDYFFNQFIALGVSYDYLGRDSDANNLDFEQNRFMVHLSGRL